MSNNGLNTDPCRTPALTLVQIVTCPLRTTPCFLLLKKSLKMFNKSPKMPDFTKRFRYV